MPWRLIPQDSGSVSWGSKLKRREQSEVTRLIRQKDLRPRPISRNAARAIDIAPVTGSHLRDKRLPSVYQVTLNSRVTEQRLSVLDLQPRCLALIGKISGFSMKKTVSKIRLKSVSEDTDSGFLAGKWW